MSDAGELPAFVGVVAQVQVVYVTLHTALEVPGAKLLKAARSTRRPNVSPNYVKSANLSSSIGIPGEDLDN